MASPAAGPRWPSPTKAKSPIAPRAALLGSGASRAKASARRSLTLGHSVRRRKGRCFRPSDGETGGALRIVLAAGLGNAELEPLFGLSAPVRAQRGEILVTERTTRAWSIPLGSIRQTPEGSILLGSSEEDVGFDTGQKPEIMQRIARRAVLSFPFLAELQIVRAWAALRVMPPDALPIYDESA